MDDREVALVDFADALNEKASEHAHYATFETDEIAAAEHRGIAQAFNYMADKLRLVALGDGA